MRPYSSFTQAISCCLVHPCCLPAYAILRCVLFFSFPLPTSSTFPTFGGVWIRGTWMKNLHDDIFWGRGCSYRETRDLIWFCPDRWLSCCRPWLNIWSKARSCRCLHSVCWREKYVPYLIKPTLPVTTVLGQGQLCRQPGFRCPWVLSPQKLLQNRFPHGEQVRHSLSALGEDFHYFWVSVSTIFAYGLIGLCVDE